MIHQELEKIINETQGERTISSFLTKHPNVIRWTVCRTGGHNTYVLKEFPFGSKYRADFIVPMSYSGVWEVNLMELEPPDDMVITKAGLPSRRLNQAISQINDWKQYIEKNPLQFRNDLSDWCIKKDLLGFFNDRKVPSNHSGNLLNSPETCIRYNYFIIIGNRNKINREQRRKMNQLSNGFKIHTYGRVLDIAKNIDLSTINPTKNIRLTESEE